MNKPLFVGLTGNKDTTVRVNANCVAAVVEHPDRDGYDLRTMIELTGGQYVMVKESVEEVVNKVIMSFGA